MPLGWSAAGRSMLILLMLWFQLGPSIMMVAANPVGEQVIAGGATFDRAGSTLTVNQGTDKVIINWQDFSIGAGEITNFIQPSSTAAALNRVVSQNVSEIYGTLNANGQIYLINPNGLVVGATGVINTQSFIASTHDVSNAEFLAGGDLTFKSQNPKSKIQNLGAISADGGDIILIAQEVENAGNLSAPNGTVALAAGTEVLVKASDEERVFIQAATDDSKFEISNSGLISSATAELKAVGGNEFALAINNSGVIRATRAVTEKGRVFLRAVGGKVRQAGEIIASSAGGETGGEIQISGEDIELADGSLTDASGTASGGSIQVGGGLRGEQLGDFENARMVTAQQGAQLKADGGDGLVILWSDGTTVYEGDISADGQGFVEVSGKEYLTFQGTVNTGGGELWLDPFNYTIGTTEAAAIVAALASSNVTINTNNDVSGFGSSGNSSDAGDIIINADIIYQSSRNLTFLAIGDIEVNAAVQNLNGDGEINMVAGWTGSGSFNANTFTNADVTSTTLYGNGNGSVFIGSASSSVPVAVGSREGTTRVFGHDIILRGGNSADALAMIGLQTTQAQAIDGTNLQALTGQGSIPITGDIITRSTNDTTLQAGTANFTYAQIGHGGREASITVVTDIDMAVGGNLDVLSGTGGGSNVAYSQIGNGGWRARGLFSIPQGGDITISYVGGNLTMRGGDRGASSAQIGGGGIQSDHIYDGNISITNVQGNVTLTSGARARSGVFIGYGGIDNTGSGDPGGGDITLEALGNLTLTAASARGNIALVGHSSGLTELFGDVTVTIGGDVVLTGSGSNIAGIGHSAQPRSSGTLEATGDVMVQVDGNITMDRAAIGHANDTTSGNTFIGVEGDITTTANAEFSSALAADGGELRLYVGGSDLVNTAATLNGIAHGDDPLPNNQGDFAFGTGTYTAEFSYYAAQTLYNYIIDAAAALEIVNALTLGDVTIDYTLDQSLFGAIEDTDGGTQFIQIDSGITFGSDFLFSFLTTGDITVDAAIEGGGGDLTFESITMGDITINADIQLTSLAAGSGPDGSISFTTQDGDILVNSGTISTVGGGDSAGGGDITFTTMTDGNVVTIGSGEGGTGALVQTAHGVVSINTTQLNFDDATPIQTDGKTTDRTNGGLVDLTGVSSVVIDLEPTLSPLGDPRTVTIDTDVGDDGTGGDIQFAEDGEISASSLASNSDRRLILDTSGSAAAGNVSLSEVGDGDAGEFLQQVHIFATDGSSGGGVLVLNGDILLDDDGSGNASSFSFNGTSVVLSSSVTIDTEQGDTSGVNGGNVDFGDATFSADTAGFDISIDTSTTQNVTSGNIMVGSFTDDDAGGLGGFFVNDITFDAFNELVGTDGVITTGSQIFLDTDGTATGGGEVTILGSWQLSQSVSIDTNQVTAGLLNAGNMDFRFATISATTADVDLTIDSTAVTSANANGGQVRFGVIDDSGGSLIRNITFVTAGGDSGGEGGNLDLHAGIEISGTFDATTRDIRFRNATNSRLDTPASITAGSVVLRAIKNEAGGTPDIEMEDSGTSNTFITSTSGAIELEAEGDVQLMEVNSADNLTVTAGETILLGDDVTSVGTQSFSNTALLLTDVTVDGAGISFDGTVDSSSGNNFSLTVNDSG
ncbi:MAG: filamentous hemagglutinin N-terminal domain-containing protein, partial [Verrucomicrobiota bacterium]